MNSDTRPRNGGAGRRRRGGRNRRHQHGFRPQPQETNLFKRLLAWLFGKKKSPEVVNNDVAPERERSEERPPRKELTAEPPVPQEITSPKLYVGNLSYDAAESDLFDLFSKVGAVRNVEVVLDRQSNRSKGFGFVEMEELETAKQAVDKLNRTDFMGRQIVVSGAKTDRR
jgi:hypothetical protein